MEIFNNEDYTLISQMVEKRIPLLRENEEFNKKYLKIIDIIEELETILNQEQQEKFNEILDLFYQTEEYYFALSYSLGVKYGEDLRKL